MFDHEETPRGFSKVAAAGVAAGVLCLAFGGYALHEHNVTESLTAENGQLVANLSANRAQLDQLTATVNSMVAREAQQQQATAPAAGPATEPVGRTKVAAKRPAIHRTAVHHVRRRRDDPRFKKMQDQLDAQNKAIEDTRSDITNARTELTGSIAKTHGELVLLERKGERNYFEFDINKSKQFQHDGQVGIRLRKANDKHQYADLELLVDDRDLSQKHVNLYQPLMFYTPDSPQPVELVINKISKDHIHGYVSTSKYRQSELAAMSNASNQSTAGADPDAQAQQRQKLTVPQQ